MLGTDETIWKDLLNTADSPPKEQEQENKKTFCFLLCFGVKRRENGLLARKNGEKRRKIAGRTVCSL
jgi:hypothetical protein